MTTYPGIFLVDFALGPMLESGGRISDGLIHVTDWLPTLVAAAGSIISNYH
jgi:hypothetical protein